MSVLLKYDFFQKQKFQLFFTIGLFATLTTSLIATTFLKIFNLETNFWLLGIDLLSTIFLSILYQYPLPIKDEFKHDPFNIYQILFLKFKWKESKRIKKIIFTFALVPWVCVSELSGQGILYWFEALKIFVMGYYLYEVLAQTMGPLLLRASLISCSVLLAVHGIAVGWLLIEGYSDPLITAYNKAFYWSMTTLTTIGYGDITPSTNISRIYTTIIMVIGVGMYGIIFGNISRLLMNADRHKEAKKEKMNDMAAFLRHYEIPQKLRREVFVYYHGMFSRHLSDKDNQIIGELPTVLQDELKLYMKVKLARELSIFSDLKLSCLRLIATKLKTQSFSPGQAIIKKGDLGNEMFIINHGEVEIIVENNVVATMMQGQFFGEVALIENITRTADVQSRSYCELHTLKKEDYLEIVEKFPELEARFQKQYQKRSSDKDESLKKAS